MKVGFDGLSNEINLLLKNRIFASGTVDAVLQDRAIILTKNNIDALYKAPVFEKYSFDKLSKERPFLYLLAQQIDGDDDLNFIRNLAKYTANIANIYPIKHESNNKKYYPTPDDYFWGGTEEMLIAKGTDWCAEVARVFCALAQMRGLPTRVVYTFSMDDGHVLNEAYVGNKWVLVDSTKGFIYEKGQRLFNLSDSIANENEFTQMITGFKSFYYSNIRFFQILGVSEYILAEAASYSYKINFCNSYYRKILQNIWNQ